MQRLVIDTETGGLRAHEHSLLTVGMLLVDVTPKKLSFIDESHIFIKHDEYVVGKTAMRINNIDLVEHHKIASPAKTAFSLMNDFVAKHALFETPILGHNVHFDLGFLSAFCDTLQKPFPFSREKDDTMFMWRRMRKEGLVNPFKDAKLGTIADHFDIDYSNAHDALGDCKITAKCFHEMMKLKDENQ